MTLNLSRTASLSVTVGAAADLIRLGEVGRDAWEPLALTKGVPSRVRWDK
jgi:hypothetical protein